MCSNRVTVRPFRIFTNMESKGFVVCRFPAFSDTRNHVTVSVLVYQTF
ncbi:Uncharacterised protein [Vibrio cholerae]|uniref:Uncharacterized protein n=1 Tax=Vibrio cholerae TaxID=666 RepID=A0A655PCH1_VIBCL|nr:Uncharacterised protein [Vibrio cholerae]CSC11904.1 Uncharacterised protein [Vibrio cholerae]